MKEKKPNFFIAGAPKCGTTALSEYLRTHQNIFISTPKEPHFFADDIKPYSGYGTLADYLEIFEVAESQHSAVGEASVLYLYSEFALNNIYKFNNDAKIIIMLRNPVDYIYSYHSQLLINGDEDIEDFETAWKLQEYRKKGTKIPKTCRVPKLLNYKEVGKLGEQVEKLLQVFPKEQIHFILLDDLKNDTKQVYEEVLEFLEVPNNYRNDFPIINENTKHLNKKLGQFRNSPPKSLMEFSRFIKKMFGLENVHFMKKLHEMNRVKAKREPLGVNIKEELLEVFTDDINILERLIERDLSDWKKV